MKKTKTMKILSWMILFTMIIAQFPGGFTLAQAEDLVGFPFFTNITLMDGAGNDLSEQEDVSKNADVRLKYEFSIPDEEENLKDKTYNFIIPPQIGIQSQENLELKAGEGEDEVVFARVKVDTDGTGTVTFTEFADEHAGVQGFFYIDTEFDQDEIGNENPVKIVFTL